MVRKPGDALKITFLSYRPVGLGLDRQYSAVLVSWPTSSPTPSCIIGTTIPGSSLARCTIRAAACRCGRFAGTIGVARWPSPGLRSIIPPRRVGGNMDVRDIAEGV